jgi:predicted esterase
MFKAAVTVHASGLQAFISRSCSRSITATCLPAEHYRLLDIPVDLLAGGADGIIPPSCVVRHVQSLRSAGVPCSFRILQQLGHMDMTLAVKGDIRLFVLSKLSAPLP